jgi:hypothetical protein
MNWEGEVQRTIENRSVPKRILKAGILALIALPLSVYDRAAANECITTSREDNAWQNWYAENKCPEQVTIHFTDKTAGGMATNGVAFALGCKRTQITQTFLSSEITIVSYDEPSHPGSCLKSGEEQPKPPSTNLKSILDEQSRTNARKKAESSEYDESIDNVRRNDAVARETENKKCTENEMSCQSLCAQKSAAIKNGPAFQNGYISGSLMAGVDDNCSAFCSNGGTYCRLGGDTAATKADRASKNLTELAATLNANIGAYNDMVRRRQEEYNAAVAAENERANAAALAAINSFMTGFTQAGNARCRVCVDAQDCARFC